MRSSETCQSQHIWHPYTALLTKYGTRGSLSAHSESCWKETRRVKSLSHNSVCLTTQGHRRIQRITQSLWRSLSVQFKASSTSMVEAQWAAICARSSSLSRNNINNNRNNRIKIKLSLKRRLVSSRRISNAGPTRVTTEVFAVRKFRSQCSL